ncbi:hypothetical protein C8R44DRAFT_885551 [Mycena epipterygia]|nr:hypothetical protein C8R44DRAFT_885551 [Mycena epipterygia]
MPTGSLKPRGRPRTPQKRLHEGIRGPSNWGDKLSSRPNYYLLQPTKEKADQAGLRRPIPTHHPSPKRPSPAHRYLGKGSRPAAIQPVHPLSLQVTSLVDDAYGNPLADEDLTPIEEHSFFLPNAPPSPTPLSAPSPGPFPTPSPSPSASAHSPSPTPSTSARSPSPSTHAPSPSAAAPSPPPSPSLTATPGLDNPMEDIATDTVFQGTTRTAFIAATPTFRPENPHRPSPAHDPDDERRSNNTASSR